MPEDEQSAPPGSEFVKVPHDEVGDVPVKDAFERFDEGNFADLSDKQLNDVYRQLRYSDELSLKEIMQGLPQDFKPKFRVGEELQFGSSNSSGGLEIWGLQIVLPTGRFAVLLKNQQERRMCGVLKDASVEPSWSAKVDGWVGDALDQPTAEETAFLKNMGVKI